ncbi:hypothetical protein AAF712_005249 [Marasmius tenuissimus]|uniref:Uncharacterized protein n=1 Tax=Marasmius tenuissimus TaxID=585030 RepID=A0ABR3A490_9AGAR
MVILGAKHRKGMSLEEYLTVGAASLSLRGDLCLKESTMDRTSPRHPFIPDSANHAAPTVHVLPQTQVGARDASLDSTNHDSQLSQVATIVVSNYGQTLVTHGKQDPLEFSVYISLAFSMSFGRAEGVGLLILILLTLPNMEMRYSYRYHGEPS